MNSTLVLIFSVDLRVNRKPQGLFCFPSCLDVEGINKEQQINCKRIDVRHS